MHVGADKATLVGRGRPVDHSVTLPTRYKWTTLATCTYVVSNQIGAVAPSLPANAHSLPFIATDPPVGTGASVLRQLLQCRGWQYKKTLSEKGAEVHDGVP